MPDSYEAVHRGERMLLLRDQHPLPKELAEDLTPQARDLEIIAGRFPGELQEDWSIATDRLPYRAIRGGFKAVVARWPAGADVGAALA